MLKRIDKLGRVVIPGFLRKELGIELNEYVDIKRNGDEIIIKKMSNMLSEEAVKHLYKTWHDEKTDSEYDKGFGDALKIIIGDVK
jgi:AbrB family looped-hinge helix DNA binding protein